MLHECIAITSMNTALLWQLFFIVSLASNCLAQADAKATKNQSDSMLLVRGGTIQIGIDASKISRFEKVFDIPTAQLFQDEVPKHWVTIDGFYIDKYLVTNAQFKSFTDANAEWRPGRIARKRSEERRVGKSVDL